MCHFMRDTENDVSCCLVELCLFSRLKMYKKVGKGKYEKANDYENACVMVSKTHS